MCDSKDQVARAYTACPQRQFKRVCARRHSDSVRSANEFREFTLQRIHFFP
jgi:hypothetical protein